jgi:hypothetical protein
MCRQVLVTLPVGYTRNEANYNKILDNDSARRDVPARVQRAGNMDNPESACSQ